MSKVDPSAARELEIGEVIAGTYRIVRALGSGAMGSVYVAEELELGREVALKTTKAALLDDEELRGTFVQRFELEAKTAANILHASIVTIYRFGRHRENVLWYAMEYVPGSHTLSEHISAATKAKTFIPVDELQQYFLLAAAGLRAIHSNGVTHRDIKPSNLLVYRTAEGPALKILDFGVAHLPQSVLTHTGQMVGTPEYLAPEYVQPLLIGERAEVHPTLDLFALGVTLYRALTNQRPFKGEEYIETCNQVLTHTPPVPSSIRPELAPGWDRITMTLLAKRPQDRYVNAGALYEDLRRVDALPGYDAAAALAAGAASAQRREAKTNPIGPSFDLEASAPGLEEFKEADGSLGGSAASVPSADAAGLVGDAKSFAKIAADEPASPRRRFGSLPRPVRIGALVFGGGVALLAVVSVISLTSSAPELAPPSVLQADELAAQSKPVTAKDLIAQQTDERQRQILEEERRRRAAALTGNVPDQARLDEPEETQVAPAGARPTKKAKHSSPLRASAASALPSAPVAEAAPVGSEPRRKKIDAVVAFNSGGAGGEAPASTKLGIALGTSVDARLLTPLSSDNPSTLVSAVLDKGLTVDGKLVLPKGTRAFGTANYRQLSETAGRVDVTFNRLVLPDRSERTIGAAATTADGQGGLPARVSKPDERTKANVGEAIVDVADTLLSDAPGSRSTGRFTNDKRSDAQRLRFGGSTISVSANVKFKLQFQQGL